MEKLKLEPSPVRVMVDQTQLDNVECFNRLCSVITNDAGCTREIKSRIATAKPVLKEQTNTLFTRKLDSNLRGGGRRELVKCYVLTVAVYGAAAWTGKTSAGQIV
jgi:hypothetical protein